MKTSIWLAATLGSAIALSAQTADQEQTRTRARSQTKDQAQAQTQSRLRKQDGSCGQTPGTGQRLGQSSGNRGGRGR